MAEQIKINSLVPPTWNRLQVNEKNIELPGQIKVGNIVTGTALSYGDISDIETGCGRELDGYLEKFVKPVKVENHGADLLTIKKEYTEDAADILYFDVPEGETVNILTDVSSKDGSGLTGILQILVRAGKNSKVNITQVIRPGKETTIINDIGVKLSSGAEADLSRIYAGEGVIGSGYRVDLEGEASCAKTYSGLVRGSDTDLDMNYVMKHFGVNTKSEINVSGALSGTARKTFRGVIDFIRGCAGADGAENENVLILDDTVVNRTVPLILCTEENVAGSHGASIGRPADEQLYYMMSRGIDKERALKILERASLESAVTHIENPEAKEYVMNIIDGIYADE